MTWDEGVIRNKEEGHKREGCWGIKWKKDGQQRGGDDRIMGRADCT